MFLIFPQRKFQSVLLSSSSSWAYEQPFFPSAQKICPFSNPNPFPFEPKETKIREDKFSEMKEREESSLIFVVGERIYKYDQKLCDQPNY